MKRLRPFLAKCSLSLLVPVLFLGILEGLLRLGGVGYPTRFLLPETGDGREVWQENPFFTYSIFPPPLARSPSPILVDRTKPPDTFRIVVLGESAAQGDPLPVFGPPRVLEKILAADYPDRPIEVVNAAVTAINSHIIRWIAHDLERLEPDLVILYIGNNEVIGPFGPGTVFAGFVDSDLTIAMSGWLRKTRIGQAFSLGLALAEERHTRRDFGGVAMFKDHPVSADDPRLDAMLRRYRNNLTRIIAEAQKTGADVLLSTVAVNRTDCPPSISLHRRDLSAEARTGWDTAWAEGLEAYAAGNWVLALDAFDQAVAIDATHAELQFRRGECLVEIGDHARAKEAFDQAMHLDAFRYRTDPVQNQLLRDVAADTGVTLVDADRYFFHDAPAADQDYFVDHVHFSFLGTFTLSRLWADAIADMGLLGDSLQIADEARVREDVLFDPLAELALTQRMLGRYRLPPFNQQLRNDQRVAAFETKVRQLNEILRDVDVDAVDARYRDARQRFPRDIHLPIQWANQMMTHHRYRDVVALLVPEIERFPTRRANRAMLARAYALLNRPEEGADALLGWSDRHGYFAFAEWTSIAQAMIPDGRIREARDICREVTNRVHPLDYRWRLTQDLDLFEQFSRQLDRAKTLVRRDRAEEAESLLRQLVDIFPDAPEPHFWRGVLRGRGGDIEAGMPHIETAMQLWRFARAFYHVGLWEARTGPSEAARQRFREAAARAGDDRDLINSVTWILAAFPDPELRDLDTAHRLIESALEGEAASDPILLDTSAAVAAIRGDMTTALARSQRAREVALSRSMNDLVAEIDQRRELYRRGERAGWGDVNAPMNVF